MVWWRKRRLTGLSSPWAGLQWEATRSDAAWARDTLVFFEGRRVLFGDLDLEHPEHAIRSVIEIRSFITETLQKIDPDSPLNTELRLIRAACIRFSDAASSFLAAGGNIWLGPLEEELDVDQDGTRTMRRMYNTADIPDFFDALKTLRKEVGVQAAELAKKYDLGAEWSLAGIFPAD